MRLTQEPPTLDGMNEDLRRGDGISFVVPQTFLAAAPESSEALKRKAKDARKAYEAAKAREKDRKRACKAHAKAEAKRRARRTTELEVARATLLAVAENSTDDMARVRAALTLKGSR